MGIRITREILAALENKQPFSPTVPKEITADYTSTHNPELPTIFILSSTLDLGLRARTLFSGRCNVYTATDFNSALGVIGTIKPNVVIACEETVAKLGPREQLALFSKTILEPKSRYVLMLEELTLPFIEEALDKDKITL